MARVVGWNKAGLTVIIKGFQRPFTKMAVFFKLLGNEIDKDTKGTFQNQGAWKGRAAWKRFSPRTLKSPSGTWNIRYGTDLKGRPKGSYDPSKIRSGIRRYSGASKLLQASGLFRDSFQVRTVNNKRVIYSTNHRLKGQIGSNPERQVIQFTMNDRLRYGRMFSNFIDKGIIF